MTHDASGKTIAASKLSSNLNTFAHESDIDYGHEPQYLHNVRRIDTNTGKVDTLAGSYIPGIFEPDTDMTSPHNPARSDGNSFSHIMTAKSGGAGGASKGGSVGGGSVPVNSDAPGMSRVGAGSSFIDELLGWKSDYIVASYSDAKPGLSSRASHAEDGKGKGKGGGSVVGSHNTYFADGFYSYNLTQCPVCPNRRNLREAEVVDLMTMGSRVGNYVEKGSFQDGSVIYAQFFKNTGITIYPDASTIYIGDTGNNRVRNITCSGAKFTTVEPTFAPTRGPTFKSTQVPSKAPALAKAVKPGKAANGGVANGKAANGKAGNGKAVNGKANGNVGKVWKVKKVGGKEASMSIGGANFGINYSSLPQLSAASLAMVAVASVALSAAFVHFMFYRKYYMESMKW